MRSRGIRYTINTLGFLREISSALHDLMLQGIEYEKVAGQHWEMRRIEQEAEEGIVRYLNNLYEVKCCSTHVSAAASVCRLY